MQHHEENASHTVPRVIVRRTRRGLDYRFWAKVERRDPTDCWPWRGSVKKNGYGQIGDEPEGNILRRKKLYAHRVAYELARGPIPNGLHVLHRCDNPACANPAHLFLGTHQDNMADMVAKRRHVHGDRQTNRKLDQHRVRAIRWLALHDPAPHHVLAHEFSVSTSNVDFIVRRLTWKLAA